jgi:hypothetical protein
MMMNITMMHICNGAFIHILFLTIKPLFCLIFGFVGILRPCCVMTSLIGVIGVIGVGVGVGAVVVMNVNITIDDK